MCISHFIQMNLSDLHKTLAHKLSAHKYLNYDKRYYNCKTTTDNMKVLPLIHVTINAYTISVPSDSW